MPPLGVILFMFLSVSLLRADWPEALINPRFDGIKPPQTVGAVGDGWFAMSIDSSSITVVNYETGESLGIADAPTGAIPDFPGSPDGFEIEGMGYFPVADGDRLAVLCRVKILKNGVWNGQYGLAIAVWEVVPNLRLVGVKKIGGGGGHGRFLSMANGRIVVFSAGSFYQWDADDLQPLSPIALPEGVTQPESTPSYTGYNGSWQGDGVLVYTTTFENGVVTLVNLDEAAVKEIRIPSEFQLMHGRHAPSGFGKTCLIPLAPVGTTGAAMVGFFDLEAGEYTGSVRLAGSPPANNMLLDVSEDGHWQAFLGYKETVVFSGKGLVLSSEDGLATGLEPSAAFSTRYGLPYALKGGRLWFSRSGQSKGDELVFSVPFGGRPEVRSVFNSPVAAEADGSISLTLNLETPAERDLVLKVDTRSGTAIQGADYHNFPGSITLAAGDVSATITATLIGDQVLEGAEYFEVEIRDPSGTVWIPEPLKACVIRGSEPVTVDYTESWTSLSARPWDTGIAGGYLIQANRFRGYDYAATSPKIMRKPLRGGEWAPSDVWAGEVLAPLDFLKIRDSTDHKLLILQGDQAEVATVYDGENDRLLYRRNSPYGRSNFAIASDAFLYKGFAEEGGLWEASWEAGNATRKLSEESLSSNYRYTNRFLVEENFYGEVLLNSRRTGTLVGRILKSEPWIGEPTMYSDGEVLVLQGEHLVLCDLSDVSDEIISEEVRYSILKAPGVDPADFDKVVVTDGKVVAGRMLSKGELVFDVFDAQTSEWMGRTSCMLPPSNSQNTFLRSLAGEGDDFVASFYSDERHEIAHFNLKASLPGIEIDPELREGGGGLRMELDEAAPVEMMIDARIVTDDPAIRAQWQGEGRSVVIPAGVTVAYLPLMLVDDETPKPDGVVQVEVRLRGNGHETARRGMVSFRDDDAISIDGLVKLPFPRVEELHALGDGWVGKNRGSGLPELDWLRWSTDAAFQNNYPLLPQENPVYFYVVGSAEDWVAIRTPPILGPTLTSGLAPQLLVYKPSDPEAPTHYLKGVFAIDNFAADVSISEDRLWVGVPGIGADRSLKPRAGSVRRYDLTNSRFRKTLSPPTDVKWNFGTQLVNNGESLWVASPNTKDELGAITQYGALDDRVKRTIWAPQGNPNAKDFGMRMVCNSKLLIAHLPDSAFPASHSSVFGYSAADGSPYWTLGGGNDHSDPRFGYATELIGEDLLLVAGQLGWTFYGLEDPRSPRLLVQVRLSSATQGLSYSFRHNGPYLTVSHVKNRVTQDSFLLDLRQLGQLWPYVGIGGNAIDWSSLFIPNSSPLSFRREGRTWKVNLPENLIPPQIGEVVLECSEDLEVWSEVLHLSKSGEWVLNLTAATSHALHDDGKSLVILGERKSCFLRFRNR